MRILLTLLFIHSYAFSDDLLTNKQWYLGGNEEFAGANILKAWEEVDKKSDLGIFIPRIAIIDSGIDYNHPDLQNIILKNTEEIPDNLIDDDQNGYVDDYLGIDLSGDGDLLDNRGHGTSVAGVIAANQNSFGVHGILKQVEIVPIKILGERPGSINSSNLVKALEYAISRDVDIINLSLGSRDLGTQEVFEVLKLAEERGIIVVAGAGNDSLPEVFYPGKFSRELSNIIVFIEGSFLGLPFFLKVKVNIRFKF